MRLNNDAQTVVASQEGAAWLPAETDVNKNDRRIEQGSQKYYKLTKLFFVVSSHLATGRALLLKSHISLLLTDMALQVRQCYRHMRGHDGPHPFRQLMLIPHGNI